MTQTNKIPLIEQFADWLTINHYSPLTSYQYKQVVYLITEDLGHQWWKTKTSEDMREYLLQCVKAEFLPPSIQSRISVSKLFCRFLRETGIENNDPAAKLTGRDVYG